MCIRDSLGPDERSFFMGLLENKVNEGAIDLAAYCVMSNHAHMVVHCDLVSLANAMSSINTVSYTHLPSFPRYQLSRPLSHRPQVRYLLCPAP